MYKNLKITHLLEPYGVIRKNWNDTEKISMAPAQGWHAQIENVSLFLEVGAYATPLTQKWERR